MQEKKKSKFLLYLFFQLALINDYHFFQAFSLIMFMYILFALKDVPLNIRVFYSL